MLSVAVCHAFAQSTVPTLSGITPISCVDCGDQAQCYDHRDYLAPFAVEPVCQACNARRGMAVGTFTNHPEYWLEKFNWAMRV